MKKYLRIRHELESGDVVFFERKKRLGWGWLIEKVTGSRVVHCGIIIRDEGRIWLFEAHEKYGVRLIYLSKVNRDFCVYRIEAHRHGGVNRAFKNEVFALAGDNYELDGAIMAGLGLFSQHKDSWYCSEICRHILQKIRKDIDFSEALTPGDLRAALDKANIQYFWVNALKKGVK